MCPEGYDTILDISCEKCYNIISDWYKKGKQRSLGKGKCGFVL